MAGRIEVVYSKLDRAKFHAQELQDKWVEFVHGGAYAYTVYVDVEPPHALHCRWQVRSETTEELRTLTNLALIFGDMLTNLRATLDYLIWQLVLAAGNTPTNQHAFPCVKVANNWASAAAERLVGIEAAWVNEIKQLQPYHRGNQPERHMLAVLDHINNVNKHRTLPPVIVTAEKFNLAVEHPDLGGRELNVSQSLDRPIEDGVEFYCMTFDPPLGELKIGPDPDLPLRVSFRDGLDHSDGWGYSNDSLVAWVEDAVAIFNPAFAS